MISVKGEIFRDEELQTVDHSTCSIVQVSGITALLTYMWVAGLLPFLYFKLLSIIEYISEIICSLLNITFVV
jgi:hypothetical protein